MKKMVTVQFTEQIILPRFTVQPGELWNKRRDRVTQEGFDIGGGRAKPGTYKILQENNSAKTH